MIQKTRLYLRSTSLIEFPNEPWRHIAYNFFLRSAGHSVLTELSSSPEETDLILYTDSGSRPYSWSILRDPIYQAHRRKCVAMIEDDNPIPSIRGFYASLPNTMFQANHAHGGFYAGAYPFPDVGWESTPQLLGSFAGSCRNHQVRMRLKEDGAADIVVDDLSDAIIPAFTRGDEREIRRLRERFVAISGNSHFVLCPRGVGASSARIFEAMQMGRAPVIISDEWLPPSDVPWEKFSIRIEEKALPKLREILCAAKDRAREMGAIARTVWEETFSERSALDSVVRWARRMTEAGDPTKISMLKAVACALRPDHLECIARFIYQGRFRNPTNQPTSR